MAFQVLELRAEDSVVENLFEIVTRGYIVCANEEYGIIVSASIWDGMRAWVLETIDGVDTYQCFMHKPPSKDATEAIYFAQANHWCQTLIDEIKADNKKWEKSK